jgi:hypothetical protein
MWVCSPAAVLSGGLRLIGGIGFDTTISVLREEFHQNNLLDQIPVFTDKRVVEQQL